MNDKKNKIFVLIPVFNRIRFTKRCLSSLENQTHQNYQVILIDDGSTDGTAKYFRRKYPDWTLVRGTGNWWWTRSIYEGVKEALKTAKRDDFILTMNNDCYFKSNYLNEIVKAGKQNKKSIIGSLILYANNPKKVKDAGVKIIWEKALIYGVAQKTSNAIRYYTARGILTNLDTLPGKGTLIPVKVFNKIGNFNYKKLPHYLGDFEFFCRAERSGFNLVVSSKSRLYNFVKETGTQHIKERRASYSKVLHVLFGRKSKLNIVDQVNFLLLSCPKKYLFVNLKMLAGKLVHYSLKVFPLYYVAPLLSFIKLAVHNIPIIIKQTFERIEKYHKSKKFRLSEKIGKPIKVRSPRFRRYIIFKGKDTLTKLPCYNFNLVEYGTKYGGWKLPNKFIDQNSVVYSAGAGEDISFDISLINKNKCHVFVFDPTPRAIKHYKLIKNNYKKGKKTFINNNPKNTYQITKNTLKNLHYYDIGLWNSKTKLKFYAPKDSNHVSHSVLNLQKTNDYFIGNVDKITNIMKRLSHNHIDLIKLDIEGAEYKVIDSLINDGVRPNLICVEYDEIHNPINKGFISRIKKSLKKLNNFGYEIIFTNGRGKYTLMRKNIKNYFYLYLFYPFSYL